MKSTKTRLTELAALHVLGALEGSEAHRFEGALASDADTRHSVAAISAALEALAGSLPASAPPPALRERILKQVEGSKMRAGALAHLRSLVPAVRPDSLAFLAEAASPGWLPLPVAGASVKVLSFDEARGVAVVLGKLDPDARYPSHRHLHGEDVFMVSGDLHIGDDVLRAGDFHHAEAGSLHGVNWSESGCVLLAVLSQEDLLNQLVPT